MGNKYTQWKTYSKMKEACPKLHGHEWNYIFVDRDKLRYKIKRDERIILDLKKEIETHKMNERFLLGQLIMMGRSG